MNDDASKDLLRKTGTLSRMAIEQASPTQAEILRVLLDQNKELTELKMIQRQTLDEVRTTNGRVTRLEERRNEDDLRQSMESARKEAVKGERERLKKPIKLAAALAKFVGFGLAWKFIQWVRASVRHLPLIAVALLLAGCAQSTRFSPLDTQPVAAPLAKTSAAIHEAQTQVGAFKHGVALRDGEIFKLRSTLATAQSQAALAQQAVVTLHVQAAKQADLANKQAARADSAEKKLATTVPHLNRLRIAVSAALVLGGLFYFLGPLLKASAGPYGLLIPSALAGAASCAIGALISTALVWLLALFGIL